jgi:hypothetical protein
MTVRKRRRGLESSSGPRERVIGVDTTLIVDVDGTLIDSTYEHVLA